MTRIFEYPGLATKVTHIWVVSYHLLPDERDHLKNVIRPLVYFISVYFLNGINFRINVPKNPNFWEFLFEFFEVILFSLDMSTLSACNQFYQSSFLVRRWHLWCLWPFVPILILSGTLHIFRLLKVLSSRVVCLLNKLIFNLENHWKWRPQTKQIDW